MELLDGRKIKLELLKELKEKIQKLDEKPTLAVVQVGNDEASNVYVRQKEKMGEEIGINIRHINLEESVNENVLLGVIEGLNKNDDITGIILQMPLPKKLNARKIQNAIIYHKDVDGLTDYNAGLLMHNRETAFIPCTVNAVIDILNYYDIDYEGKNVVIVGRSDLVGKPLANLLTNKNATVTLCHSKTINLRKYTQRADVLITATGKPYLIKAEDIKEGVIIIDVGINKINGKIVGDVDFESVKDKVSCITPVPGGIGQLTVANLVKNTYKAYKLQKYIKRY